MVAERGGPGSRAGDTGPAGPSDSGGTPLSRFPRLNLVAERDASSAALLARLLRLPARALPQARVPGDFAFTLAGVPQPHGGWEVRPTGISRRYGVMVALGLLRLPEPAQRAVLGGADCHEFIGQLARDLDTQTSLGDVALLCWAAAEAGHSELPHAVRRLADLDQPGRGPLEVMAAAWVVTALVAARSRLDVEAQLAAARRRLLAGRGAAAYPHTIGGATTWYRSHVGSFADQVYPLQALARLHRSADDPMALAVAESVAAVICRNQGAAGQWWWHYDTRTGGVVEGYPVYSVHQHAMAPMALLDLAEAGGYPHYEAVCRGLRWLARPPETGADLVLDDPPVAWRKVARNDPAKAVRGLRAAASRVRRGTRLPALDRAFPPGTIDHECRPYELGWLLLAWLSGREDDS